MTTTKQIDAGFKYIKICLESLEEYYEHINEYKDFEEYFPQIIKEIKSATNKKELTI